MSPVYVFISFGSFTLNNIKIAEIMIKRYSIILMIFERFFLFVFLFTETISDYLVIKYMVVIFREI